MKCASTFLAAYLLLAAAPSFAKSPTLPPVLAEVERNYTKAGTLIARFEQVNESTALKTKKKSAGNIAIKRPNKMRWQTLTPDPNLLVSDGKRAWFYTPSFDSSERGQYSELPASRIQSKLASALLSGNFSTSPDLVIKAESNDEFLLQPRPGTAGTVIEARVQIDPKSKTITRVQLWHKDGNKSDIHLSDIKLGEKIDDEVFTFKAPPNTDRVQ